MSDETKYMVASLRNHGLDGAADLVKLQAERIEELEEWQRQMVEKAADESLDGYREMGAKCAALEEQKDKLKQENATLRATAELVETALRDYVRVQSKIDDRWEVSDAVVQHQLLRGLHFCEALGREALEALKANAAQPTSKPTDSDGSGT